MLIKLFFHPRTFLYGRTYNQKSFAHYGITEFGEMRC